MKKKTLEDGQLIVIIGSAVIAVLFTLYGFVFKQPCNGIDVSSLYCALHPFSGWDVLGCILVYGGFLFITGLWALVAGNVLLPVGSVWPNYAAFAAMALGMVLIFA